MAVKAAGSVFWPVFLVLFPVAGKVQLPSLRCVTYKCREICGFKGSSIRLPCSYPNNSQITSISGWFKKEQPNMEPKQLKKINYSKHGNCTITLTDLKHTDTSIYQFVYNFKNAIGNIVTCRGLPGVKLNILAAAVRILVEELVREQYVPVADRTVIEGQRITLTCVPTCTSNLNSNPAYIWYKNRRQLNGSRANSRFLSLDPISDKDAGRYVCIMIGYTHLPSRAVNLKVQRRPINIEIPGGGSTTDRVPTQTHNYDAQNSTDQILNNYQTPNGQNIFTFPIMIIVCVRVGWVIAVTVTILVFKVKKKMRRRCAGSVPGTPNPNRDFYMALDIKSMSADYDTLDTGRRCSADDPIYENLDEPGN